MKDYVIFNIRECNYVYIKKCQQLVQVKEKMFQLKEINNLMGIPMLAIFPALIFERWYLLNGTQTTSIIILVVGTFASLFATYMVFRKVRPQWDRIVAGGRDINLSPAFLNNFIHQQKRLLILLYAFCLFTLLIMIVLWSEFFNDNFMLKYLIAPISFEGCLFSLVYMTSMFERPKVIRELESILTQNERRENGTD